MAAKVYAIGWDPAGPLKVGMANNSKRRMADLQVGCPYRLEVLAEGRVTHQRVVNPLTNAKLEELLHKALAGRRIRGDWYAISQAELEALVGSIQFTGGKVQWTTVAQEKHEK